MMISSSAPSSLRKPSRKIAWSSARRTRICCFDLAMSTERNLDGQTRSMARIRLDSQHAPHSTRTFLDGDRTQPQTIELIPGESPGEAEPFAVIVNHQNEAAILLRQFYHDMGSLRMFFYVIKCFTVNLEKFAADAVRSLHFDGIDEDVQG